MKRSLFILPLLLAVASCSIPLGSSAASGAGSSAQSASTATVEAVADLIPAGTIPGEGDFLVPADVALGTYRSAGPDGSKRSGCFRWTYADTGKSDTVDSDFGDGPAVIEVNERVKLVRTSGCKPFKKVG